METGDETVSGHQNNRQFRAYAMYMLAMFIFGTNGLLVSHISLESSQIVLMRTLIGGVLVTGMVLIRGGFDKENVSREWRPLLLGGAALGLNWIALFEAYRLLNVSLATLIYYAGPILTLLCSPVLFHEKLNGRQVTAGAVVAVGLVCISGSVVLTGMNPAGLLTAVISALFYAALIVVNKRITHTGGMETAAIELDAAAVVTLVYVLCTSGLPHMTAADIPYIAAIGVINTGLAYYLYFSGLQSLSGQTVALLSYLDPVSALCFSALFLNEMMTPVQILGAVLIIGGAVFGELNRRRETE